MTKGASNEKLTAGLFFVLVLYHVPFWLEGFQPFFFHFSVLLAAGLALDTAVGFIRHKKSICAVSAAVTATIVNILLHGLPLPLKLLGVTAALLRGDGFQCRKETPYHQRCGMRSRPCA